MADPCCPTGWRTRERRRPRGRRLAALLRVQALGAAVVLAPPAATGSEVPLAVAEHPVWTAEGMLDAEQRTAVGDRLDGRDTRRILRLLDVLDEARSPIADGDHGEALVAYLELPRSQRRRLGRWFEARREELVRARDTGDTDELRQLQTRVSLIVSELSGRRRELSDRGARGRVLRDLRLLGALAETALWERHALNWRLRGPLRLATTTADRHIARFYRRRDGNDEPFTASARAAYLKVLARLEGGGFDALNGYDWGGISVGLAQFAATGPYLGRLLQRVERDRPKLYRRHVADRGLRVDGEGWVRLEERPLLDAIRDMDDQNEFNPVLLAFAGSLEAPELRDSLFRHQIVVADELIDRAMALETEDGARPAVLLSSSRGRAHLADAFVNTGADTTLGHFEVARRRGAGGGALVDAFIAARREFYESTGQPYQLARIEAIEETFARQQPPGAEG